MRRSIKVLEINTVFILCAVYAETKNRQTLKSHANISRKKYKEKRNFDFSPLFHIMYYRIFIASMLLITILCVPQSCALTTLAGGWKPRDHKKSSDHNKSSSLEFKVLQMKVQMFCAMYPKSFLCNP